MRTVCSELCLFTFSLLQTISVLIFSYVTPWCSLSVYVSHSMSLALVFQFDLNIKRFVLSLHSITVSGRRQVTLSAINKQFIALEYKYHCGISTVHCGAACN